MLHTTVEDGTEDDNIMTDGEIQDGSEDDNFLVPPTIEDNNENDNNNVKPTKPTENLPKTGKSGAIEILSGLLATLRLTKFLIKK